jgi:signal transduction histidine kinase
MDVIYLYFSFSALLNTLVSAFLGFFILFRGLKSKVNQIFALFSLSVAMWSLFYIFWPLADTASETLFFFQLLHIGVCFAPIFYFHFVVRWLEIFEKKKLLVYFGYFLALFFVCFIPTKLFIAEMVPKFSMRYWAEPGILYHFYLLMFFGFFLYSSFLLFRQYRLEIGVKREQIKFILIGFFLSFLGGSTNYFLWYDINIPPYGNIIASSFVVFTAYAILRYRFMDLRQVARTFLIYAIDAVVVYLFYLAVAVGYPMLWGELYNSYAILAGIIISPLFVIFIFKVHNFVTYLIDKYFFYSLYDYKKTIAKLSAELNYYNDLDKIIDLMVETIKTSMGLSRAGVLLAEELNQKVHYKVAKVTGFDINNGISLVKDSFFTRYLKKHTKPLVREELPFLAKNSGNSRDSQALLKLDQEMKKIEASLCLPLVSSKKLIGIIVLGGKESGDPYTDDDLNLLFTLSMQASVAIDNALMYREVKSFNKVLQQKVDEQTGELKKRALHLEKLLKMREEFLDIASHQLKTPVSVIRGTLSMFMDGSMDKLSPEERKKFLGNIYKKTEKLNIIIADILRASELDTEEFTINPETAKEINLIDLLKEVYDDLKELARAKNLDFKLILPKVKIPPVITSDDFLEQAIYNLTDNAIKYTQHGFIKLELLVENKEITIKISDSGIGIPELDQKKLFDKFARAGNAVGLYTDGSGLGLFIAKKIIEAHDGGNLTFESKEGKGTTFIIKLKGI